MTTRRDMLIALGGSLGIAALGGLRLGSEEAQAAERACTAGTITRRQTEGPYFKPNTPQRRNIREPGTRGSLLIVTGRVLDSQCRPIAGAVIDFWQTGDAGGYDNQGFRYRGHQVTDAQGCYELLTIRPMQYSEGGIFRTPHIHAKLQGAGTDMLNTQLYFPDAEATNRIDRIFDPSLLVELQGSRDGARLAMFDFVLARA
jgi:protocatechuate 3,4-dioxygenase beta subunit